MANNLTMGIKKMFKKMSKQKANEEIQEDPIESKDINQESNIEENAAEVDELTTLQNEIGEWKNKYLRLHAEFDNFRKRNIKERAELIKSAGSSVMSQIIPVLDDLDRAMIANEKNEDIVIVKEGFDLIHNKLFMALEHKGLKAMDAKGQDFDTDLHEAITQIPGDPEMKGKVVEVVEKGYYLNDHILRFAKVVVGS